MVTVDPSSRVDAQGSRFPCSTPTSLVSVEAVPAPGWSASAPLPPVAARLVGMPPGCGFPAPGAAAAVMLEGVATASDGGKLAWRLSRPRSGVARGAAPLVLLNGLANDDAQWGAYFAAWDGARAYLYWDYRGHGRSPPADKPQDITLASQARCATAPCPLPLQPVWQRKTAAGGQPVPFNPPRSSATAPAHAGYIVTTYILRVRTPCH